MITFVFRIQKKRPYMSVVSSYDFSTKLGLGIWSQVIRWSNHLVFFCLENVCYVKLNYFYLLNSYHLQVHQVETEPQARISKEKPTPIVETTKDEQEAVWPSFGRLVIDLSKLALEALASIFFYFIPFRFSKGSKGGLTPLKDSLVMPEDKAEPSQVQKQRTPAPLSETQQAHTPNAGEKYSNMKPTKMRSTSFKDPSYSSKHRSSKRQEYAEFYGSGEAPPYGQHRSKSQKDRTKHRQREKSGEVGFGGGGVEQNPVEMKPVNYDDPKFNHYNMRSKFGGSFHFE